MRHVTRGMCCAGMAATNSSTCAAGAKFFTICPMTRDKCCQQLRATCAHVHMWRLPCVNEKLANPLRPSDACVLLQCAAAAVCLCINFLPPSKRGARASALSTTPQSARATTLLQKVQKCHLIPSIAPQCSERTNGFPSAPQ